MVNSFSKSHHFCAFVLFYCACDMDHESAKNELLLLLLFPTY